MLAPRYVPPPPSAPPWKDIEDVYPNLEIHKDRELANVYYMFCRFNAEISIRNIVHHFRPAQNMMLQTSRARAGRSRPRYVAKYTINCALAHGMGHMVGSVEVHLSLYIYIYVYIYFDMSCFRAGGVHNLQTHTIRIPYT